MKMKYQKGEVPRSKSESQNHDSDSYLTSEVKSISVHKAQKWEMHEFTVMTWVTHHIELTRPKLKSATLKMKKKRPALYLLILISYMWSRYMKLN